jgi:hypothetical protein
MSSMVYVQLLASLVLQLDVTHVALSESLDSNDADES